MNKTEMLLQAMARAADILEGYTEEEYKQLAFDRLTDEIYLKLCNDKETHSYDK